MILFLPPAPKTGAFFDTIRAALPDIETQAATYPGYGDVPVAGAASIEAYATSLSPIKSGTVLVGFHTGCLVALEMALQSNANLSLILVDIPYFDPETIQKHSAGLEKDNPAHDAFRAAFSYDLRGALARTSQNVTCVATGSNLFDLTLKAARELANSRVIERRDILKPAFESSDMAQLIRDLTA